MRKNCTRQQHRWRAKLPTPESIIILMVFCILFCKMNISVQRRDTKERDKKKILSTPKVN